MSFVLVQWARLHPRGWERAEAHAWRSLPTRQPPGRGRGVSAEGLDDAPGWITAVCRDGVVFTSADHYHVAQVGDAVRVTVWSDDPEEFGPGLTWNRYAMVWTFHPIAFDWALGRDNTRQEQTLYTEGARLTHALAQPVQLTGGPRIVRPWEEFVPPPEAETRHGAWLPNDLFAEHRRLHEGARWEHWRSGATRWR